MALTDNRTQLNDCEDDTQTFATSGAQIGTSNLAGQFIEGSGSVQSQHSNVYDDTYTSGDSAGNTFNLGAAGADTTIYLGVKDNLMNTIANAGGMIVLGDGTDRIGYTVLGSDAVGLPYKNQYIFCKLDTSDAAASPGTADVDHHVFAGTEANLNFSAITIVGFGSLHNAKAQGNVPNVFIDNIRYIANDSYAASITGGTTGTPETMADLVGDDELVGAGMFSNPQGSLYYIFAPTEWGDATADTYFSATGEQWYFVGNNGGSRSVGATHFPMRVFGGTGTTDFRLTSVVMINTGARSEFLFGDANTNVLRIDSCTLTDFGDLTFTTQSAANRFVLDSIFNNCGQVDPSTMDFDGITFNGANSDTDGALLLDENQSGTQNITDVVFNSDGTGYAVLVNPTGAGPFTYNLDNWVFNDYASDAGTAGNRALRINPATSSADITLNILNGGDTPSVDTTGYTGTLTINNSVTVLTNGVTRGTAVLVQAKETVGTVTDGDTLGSDFADVNGEYSFSLNYEAAFGAGLDVEVRARNQGIAVAVLQDDGGAFTDYTAAANTGATAGDVFPLPAVAALNDAMYLGHTDADWAGMKIYLTTAHVGTWDVIWEYWNGATWAALTTTRDDTWTGSAGDRVTQWTVPSNWATTTVNSITGLYWVRMRAKAFFTQTTQAVARKVTLDATRYLPDVQQRTITSSGLTTTMSWNEDTISEFP